MLGGMPEDVDGAGDSQMRSWRPDIKLVKTIAAFAMEN
jgi:hypothetical protein